MSEELKKKLEQLVKEFPDEQSQDQALSRAVDFLAGAAAVSRMQAAEAKK